MEKRKFSRRDFIKLSGGAASVAVIAACTPAATQAPQPTSAPAATEAPAATQAPAATDAPAATEAPPEPTEAPAMEPIEMVMWVQGDTSWDFPFMNIQKDIIAAFEEAHPGVTITREGTTEVRLDEKLLLAVRAGAVPDISQFSSQFLESHVIANTLMPTDEYMANADPDWVADLLPIEINDMTSRRTGNMYGVMNSIASRVIYYRTDLMPAAPENWDDILQYATENTDQAAGMWGYIFNGVKPWSVENIFGPFIWSQGAVLADANGMAAWTSPETARVVEWHRDLIYTHEVSSIANVTGAWGDNWKLFLAGQAAMGIDGTYSLAAVKSQATDMWENGQIWAAPIPSVDAGGPSRNHVNGWSAGIPTGSRYPAEAFAFIQHWGSKEMQLIHSPAEGGAPIVESAWAELYTDPIDLEVFLPNVLENGYTMDPFVYYLEGITTLGVAMEELLTNPNADTMEVLQAAQDEYNNKYFTPDGELKEVTG